MNWILILIFTYFCCVNCEWETEWELYKSQHDKSYRSILEEERRFNIFKSNIHDIEKHNKLYKHGLKSYKMGVNQYTDMTEDEFRKFILKKPIKFSKSEKTVIPKRLLGELPEKIDWRKKGAITPVKNQGMCGSCWAFAATGVLEAHNKINNDVLISLSEQNLIDCSGYYMNFGCFGGDKGNALDYVADHGITSEENYPYETLQDIGCRFNSSDSVLTIKDKQYLQIGEQNLKNGLALIGPVAVSIDGIFLKAYESGVYDNYNCSTVMHNHSVLVVGYGNEIIYNKTVDYWIVKNSWGEEWGEDGYARMIRGTILPDTGICGIANSPVYPIFD